MFKFSKKAIATAAVATALGVGAGQASATPTLLVTDGTNTVVVFDGGAGDGCPLAGCVLFNAAIGNWIVNIVTGETKPILGTAAAPHLDLAFSDLYTGTSASTLTILFGDTGFLPSPAPYSSEIGGTLASGIVNVTYNTFADGGNTLFGTGVSLCALSFTASPYSSTCGGTYSGATPYSLTQAITLTATGPGQTSGDASIQSVPEPATLALLGAALVGLGFSSRRKQA